MRSLGSGYSDWLVARILTWGLEEWRLRNLKKDMSLRPVLVVTVWTM